LPPSCHKKGSTDHGVWRLDENHFTVATSGRNGTLVAAFEGKMMATTDTPLGFCINDTTTSTIAGTGCWRLLFGGEPEHDEVISRPDSNDTRMQQVKYGNGKLWCALDTAINPDGGAQRAGIAWFIVKPDVSTGSLAAKVALQGSLGASGHDFTYPAIGVTPSGRGVMAFTDTGDTTNPSAAYAPIDALAGVGPWSK